MIRTKRLALPTTLLCLFVAFLAGCSETLKVVTNPSGAQISTETGMMASPMGELQLEGRDQPYHLTVKKDGYQTETVEYKTGNANKPLEVNLLPLSLTKHFRFSSTPAGALVNLDGAAIGTTPFETDIVFKRADKTKPWELRKITYALTDFQSETQMIGEASAPDLSTVLSLLRAEHEYLITTKAAGAGADIAAKLSLEGASFGSGPRASLKIVFQRAEKRLPWPVFKLEAVIPAVYQNREYSINYETGKAIDLMLDPVTEVMVERFAPIVVTTPTGPKLVVSRDRKPGTIDTAEPGADITALTRVTDYPRRDLDPSLPIETINSFAVLPQGTHAVISVTTQDADLAKTDPENSYSAHLELRSTSEGLNQRTQLTSGAGYLDACPILSPLDGAQPIVIFQSNRGDIAKPDLFRLHLDEKNTLIGGIARITTDARFNYGPSCADTNRVVVYLSMQPNYARARPQLCTITKDGALPTQFPVSAVEVCQHDIERIFFSKQNERIGKLQIFFVQSDGKLETQAIGDPAFNEANCFNPSPSYNKSGRILFVSDRVHRKGDRPNNNIYVMNADGTGIQRITANESDDILPCWSPLDNEPDVFYFVSNRGGSYNLWRAKLVSQK